jgi:hypothetical protein
VYFAASFLKNGRPKLRVHEETIDHIDAARHLNFVSIQLPSPTENTDWDFDSETQAWSWRVSSRNKRIVELSKVLEFLFSNDSPKRPDVIVCPEYAVPKEAHAKINFQKLASDNRCIIIPGSFFEDSEADQRLFRRNICHIYLPSSKVITIGKVHAAPKEDAMLPALDLPNIARLIWIPPGRKPVSINIFLCRDYLTPFSEEEPDSPGMSDAAKDRRYSLLDWDREGINIVLMNNVRSQLFEGAAAFDVREMHGQRKAVLLANCADDDSDLGTALLVASPTRERADICASIPPRITGILFAELRLWDLIFAQGYPDTKTTFPVRYVDIYSIELRNPIAVKKVTVEKPAPLGRGVWHPAFLEELRKVVVLDFFVAHSTLVAVADAFADRQIQHVKAGFVRGIHDVIIRRYAPRFLQKNGRVPLSLPFSHYMDDELRKIFAIGPSFPEMQVIIHPEKLLKYRSKKVPQGEAWNAAHDAIRKVVVTSNVNDLIEQSCALAKDMDPTPGNDGELQISEDLRPIFCLGVELYNPIGPQYGHKREYYVLIRAQRSEKDGTPSDSFRRQIILNRLMNDPNVREISEIESRPQHFDYAIQLEASSYDLDDIIFEMNKWAHDNDIAFGTRTYELWRYLSRDSIASIQHTTMDEFERDFLAEMKQAARDIRKMALTNDQRSKIAEVWQSSRKAMAPFGACRKHIGEFYLYLTLYNFQRTGAEADYLQHCRHSWLELARDLEGAAEQLSAETLGLKPVDGARKVTATQIAAAVEEKFKTKVALNKEWDNLKKYPARILAQYYDEMSGSKGHLRHFRTNLANIAAKRNWVAHAGHEESFEQFIDLCRDDWIEKMRNIQTACEQVCDAIAELGRELKNLKK